LLTVWLTEVCEKYDKFYKRGRDSIENVRGSVEFFFSFSFVACRFLANSWVLGHSRVLHLILNLKFKLCAFGVVNVLIKGDIEKLSDLCLGLFV
jgi:hypothetical protein